jgi:hypothetical protein
MVLDVNASAFGEAAKRVIGSHIMVYKIAGVWHIAVK